MPLKLININVFVFWVALAPLLLSLLHFETLSIGPVKVSHLWKGVVLVFLVCLVFKGGKARLYFYGPLFGLSLIGLFGFELLNNPLNALVSSISLLLLPVMGTYFQGLSSKQIEKAMLFSSYFVILSFVPYEIGMLQSLSSGYDLTGFGELDLAGIIGPYQRVHAASSVLACSLLIILFFYLKGSLGSLVFYPIFLMGLYFLFFTYVRTGMAMFGLGALPLVLNLMGGSLRKWTKLVAFSVVAATVSGAFILQDDILIKRIKGEGKYSSEDSIETYGSGRIYIAINTIEYFSEASVIEQVVGLGETEGLNRMEEKIGRRLFPHNGLLFILSSFGFVGLSLFLYFIVSLYRIVARSKSGNSALAKSIFVAYLVMVFLQSYELPYVFLFLGLAFSYIKTSPRESVSSDAGGQEGN